LTYLACLALVTGLGLPLAVLSAAAAQGRASAAAFEGIARQPEKAADIRGALIIALALIESLVIYSLLMFFLLWIKLPPSWEEIKAVIEKTAGAG